MKNSWKTERLGELCEFQRGLTYSKKDEVARSDNVVLRATNIDLATSQLDFTELKFISDDVLVPDSKKVKKGSLIVCTASGSKSHLGKVAYIDEDYGYAFGGFMGMITPKSGLVSRYLFHLMTSPLYQGFIGALSDGVNINNLKFDQLKHFRVPHPSPSEQRRIVAILDEASQGMTTTKANAEKNLKNARALFEAHLNAVFTECGEGWVEKNIGEVCTLKSGTTVKKSLEKATGDLPYVKVADMACEGNEDEVITSTRFLNKSDTGVNAAFPVGTTIFPKRGGAILTNKKKLTGVPIYADLNIMGVIPSQALQPKFLYFYLLNVDMRRLGSGSSIPQINNYDIAPLLIPFPEMHSEQKRIIDKLESLLAETQHLEAIYQRKMSALDELKQSLLQQAFSGNL